MDAVAELALETIAVEQSQEELKVLLLAVMRRGRHEEEVAGQAAQELAQAVALGVADLAAEVAGRHLVGLVADDEVPVRLLQLGLDVLVAAELVEAADGQRVLREPVPGPGRFQRVVGQDLERELEAAVQLVLPLLDETAGADDQAAVQVAPRDQLLDEQPGHDRLPRPGIVGQEEPQGLTGEHLAIDGGDLVGQRVDQRGMDGQ